MILKKFLLICLFIFFAFSAHAEKFKELRSEHFIITYAPQAEDAVYKIKDDSEYYYRTITQEFGLIRDKLWSWDDRAKIIITKDRESYVKEFSCPSWSGACVDYRNKIIYTYPLQNGFSSTLAHELTHIIFREYVGNNTLPLWLDEGMATYMECRDSPQLSMIVSTTKALIKENKYIKFSQINSMYSLSGGGDPRIFYNQAFSMVYFLKERFGRSDFAEFLSYLRANNNLNDALRKAFRVIETTDDFESLWKKFYTL